MGEPALKLDLPRERPILFSAPMVRAILSGSKTQTRRLVRLPHSNPLGEWEPSTVGGQGVRTSAGASAAERCCLWHTRNGDTLASPFDVGDRLWVRETWRSCASLDKDSPAKIAKSCIEAGYRRPWAPLHYEADGERSNWEPSFGSEPGKARVSIHMPRWASRLLLEVTSVRVERLQDIGGHDAVSEGLTVTRCDCEPCRMSMTMCPADETAHIDAFATLWESLNGKRAPWASNPWVWVVGFKRVESPGG